MSNIIYNPFRSTYIYIYIYTHWHTHDGDMDQTHVQDGWRMRSVLKVVQAILSYIESIPLRIFM